MKPTLKVLKKNIFTILVLIVFVVCMYGLTYFKKLYWDGNNEASYGERTAGLAEHAITDDDMNKILSNIEKDANVEEARQNYEGRIINMLITVKDNLSKSDAKKIATAALKNFTSDELAYYSFQFYMIKKDASQNDFPIIGYKHYTSDSISWTKDREVTKDEDK